MTNGFIRRRGKNLRHVFGDAPRGLKRRLRSTIIHGTQKDAEKQIREILTPMNHNAWVNGAKSTVEDFLRLWLRDYAQANLTQSTVDGYAIIMEKHLIPALGKYRLDKLRSVHIQDYYKRAMANDCTDGKGGLSPRTVLHHHRLLHKALSTAMEWGLVKLNACNAVRHPGQRHLN